MPEHVQIIHQNKPTSPPFYALITSENRIATGYGKTEELAVRDAREKIEMMNQKVSVEPCLFTLEGV